MSDRDRYAETFHRLVTRNEGVFIPFTVLGDPTLKDSLEIVRQLCRSGADALELGIPFSDPVADGPTIQEADLRALEAGVRPVDALAIVSQLRREFDAIPIGLLVYANLLQGPGVASFYRGAKEAGVDSVLVADVPTLEAAPFVEQALSCGIQPVLIATPTCNEQQLEQVAHLSRGYTYVVARAGVTGIDEMACTEHQALFQRLRQLGAPPSVLGFGISRPEHVRAALAAGATGVIAGSAVVQRISKHLPDLPATLLSLSHFLTSMKAATRQT